jgi:tetratricopeptide (TPR) repeat protein
MTELESKNVYDIWQVPIGKLVPSGTRLPSFVIFIHHLLREARYKEAIKILETEKKGIARDQNVSYTSGFIKLLLGIATRKSGECELARRNLVDAVKIFSSLCDFQNSARALIALGDVWRTQYIISEMETKTEKLIYWKKAFASYQYAAKILNNTSSDNGTSDKYLTSLHIQVLWAFSKLYLLRDENLNMVEEYLKSSWNLSSRIESIWAKEEAAQLLGRYYIKVGDLEKAISWFLVSIDEARISQNKDRLAESCLHLAKIYRSMDLEKETKELLCEAEALICPSQRDMEFQSRHFERIFNEIQKIKFELKS